MAKVRGVVFDVDGTMFDTASLIYDAYCHIAELYGYKQPTRDEVAREMGKPIPEILEALFPGADVAAMVETNTEFVMKRASVVAAFEGLEHTLKELDSRNLTLGILTSGNKKIEEILEHYGMTHMFASVIHAELVSNHKPHPEGLELAAAQMGIDVSELVMVGDMMQDIEVAKNAGALASVGVTHGFSTRQTLEELGADYVIDSLPELVEVVDTLVKKHDA